MRIEVANHHQIKSTTGAWRQTCIIRSILYTYLLIMWCLDINTLTQTSYGHLTVLSLKIC